MAPKTPTVHEHVDGDLQFKLTKNAGEVERQSYRVTDKAARASTEESVGSEGIFKNGQIFAPGDLIELDEQSAANYKVLGEVEDV